MDTQGYKRKAKALAGAPPAPLDRIRLGIGGDTPLVGYGGEEDPGAMDWWGEATITMYPGEEDDEPDAIWWEREGVALEKAVVDGNLMLTVLRASGLLVDLSRVKNVYDALDARSADYTVFCPMFDGPGNPELVQELQERLASFGSQVVLVDRVRLAPAWRGHGGVGRLLTARLLRWICPEARAVALMPSPIALDENQQEDEATLEQEMAKVRRTWKSLGFKPFGKDILVMDPAMVYHDEAEQALYVTALTFLRAGGTTAGLVGPALNRTPPTLCSVS